MREAGGKRVNPVLRRLAFLGNLGAFIFPIGAILLTSVPAVWAYQVIQWLEVGRWPAITFADGLRWARIAPPQFESGTIGQVNQELMAAPLSLVLLFGIGGFLFAYAQFSKWLEKHCEPEKITPGQAIT